MTNFRMTVRVGWTISACSPPPSDPRLPFLPPQIKKNTWYSASRQKKKCVWVKYNSTVPQIIPCEWRQRETGRQICFVPWMYEVNNIHSLSVHDSPEQNQEFLALFLTKCPISSSLGLSFTVCKMIVPFKISFSSAVLSWQFFFQPSNEDMLLWSERKWFIWEKL